MKIQQKILRKGCKMKILAITHLFPSQGNRMNGIFAARQLVEMKKQGADITLFVPMVWCPGFLRRFKRWQAYNHRWKCEYDGIEAITSPYLRMPGKWFRPWADYSVFCAIKNKVIELHKAKKFDIIYARFLHPDGYAAMRLSKILGIPAAGVGAGEEVNVYPKDSMMFNRNLIKTIKGLDGLVASGYGVANKMDRISNRKTLAIHGVVDLEKFAPIPDKTSVREKLGLPLDKFIVLYAGMYKVAKGIYEMIEAFSRIEKKTSNVVLKICGYGRLEENIRKTIKEKKLDHIIEMVGFIDPEQIYKWMQASDLFLLPSYTEGMPNTVMEAMACGLPVVATAVGGLPDAVGDCEGAILIQPKNIQAIEKTVTQVINDNELRARMQVAARKKAEESFGVRRNARRILDYLAQVIEKKQNSLKE